MTDDTGEGPDTRTTDDAEDPDFGLLAGDAVRTGYLRLTDGRTKALQYSVVGDRAVFEGDIVLGAVEEMEQAAGLLRAGDGDAVVHGIGVTGQQYRWPGALLAYEIDGAVTNGEARVAAAIAHWESTTNMRFVRRTAANAAQLPNYVRVIRGDGCWSHVGMRGGRQDLSLADGCGFGAAVHEFGHAFGLWHEQSREDRAGFVTIHWENIQAGMEHNFNQQISDGDDIGEYDYGSIMHYGGFAFSKNNQRTITPTRSGVTIGQRNGLSAGDVAAVHAMYQTWHGARAVVQVYASHHGRNAWANLAGLGWRRVHPDAPDGVTHVFAQLVWARAQDRPVTVLADGTSVYQAYQL